MAFYSWTDITAFYNIRKYALAYPNILNENNSVVYKGKTKLHGTNMGIQIHNDGNIITQSRNLELSENTDNDGFRKFVYENINLWKSIKKKNIVIYGEFCGKGIQKGVAISKIESKIFAVFAIRSMDENDDLFISEPNELKEIVGDIPNVYFIPWLDGEVVVNWMKPYEELLSIADMINKDVGNIEKCDPFVKDTFGIEGIGEGIVYYPVSKEHQGYKNYSNLAFKAKGEEHKTIKTAKPAAPSPEVAANVKAFVELVLTSGRLNQGAAFVGGFDMRSIGKFLEWISKDVLKETADELEASGLKWEDIVKELNKYARNWYIDEFKKGN